MKTIVSSLLLSVLVALGVALPASHVAHAQDVTATAAPIAVEATDDRNILLLDGLEITSMMLAVIAIIILVLVIQQFGKSAVSVVFGYFIIGTALVASARLFILVTNLGYFTLSGESLNFGWHLLFFLSMITFFIAGMGFKKLETDNQGAANFSGVLSWGLISAVLTAAVFYVMPVMNEPFTAMYAGSVADTTGLVHLIAFILGGIAAFYLFYRAKMGQVTSLLATPYLVAFGLFALNHFWELLAESWKIVNVSESMVERVEQIFVLPAFALIVYAYIRLWRLVRPRA